MTSSRRRLVFWLAGLSILAIASLAVFGRQQVAERWYIYRLEAQDSEVVDRAATRLAAMGSTRAILPLIEQIPRELAKGRTTTHLHWALAHWWTDSAVVKAIHDLGAEARALARQELSKRAPDSMVLRMLQDDSELRYSKERPVPPHEVFKSPAIVD